MKTIVSCLILAASFVACNNKPGASSTTTAVTPSDTAGLSEFRQLKVENAAAAYHNQQPGQPYQQQAATARAYRDEPRSFGGNARSSRTTYYRREAASTPAYNSTSESGHTAYRKKGMSSGAKDAIIGGAGGAVIGAIADKNNRGVGALIGGVVGGGAGYGIGHSKDKKRNAVRY